MLQSISDFISKVIHGETVDINGEKARWKKVAELTPGMKIAVYSQQSDVEWDEIVSIKRLSPEKVYDIEVEDTHNFVAGHLIETPLPKSATVGSDESPRGPPYNNQTKKWFGGIFAHNTYLNNSVNVGQAALMVDQQKAGDLFTASASGTPKFVITNAGNVGIGTTGPGDLLHVLESVDGSGVDVTSIFERRDPNTPLNDFGGGIGLNLGRGDMGVATESARISAVMVNVGPGTRNISNGTTNTYNANTSDLVFSTLNGGTLQEAGRFLGFNQGYFQTQRFLDSADNRYYLDPAQSGTTASALNIKGVISNTDTPSNLATGTFSTIVLKGSSDTTSVSVCIEGSDATTTTCDGKIDAGTFDPPYTIGGLHYSTFAPSMTGVKEETTGLVTTTEQVAGVGYRATVDFGTVPQDSDLWLFSKVTNLKKNIDKLVVLLSPQSNARAWYTLDPGTMKLSIYTSLPTQVSYRLTAPRFDWTNWSNRRYDNVGGFKIADDTSSSLAVNTTGSLAAQTGNSLETVEIVPKNTTNAVYGLKTTSGTAIEEFGAFSEAAIGTLKTGLVTAQQVAADSITVAGQPLADYVRGIVRETLVSSPISQSSPISPISPTEKTQTNVISPVSSESPGVSVKLGEGQTFSVTTTEGTPAATFDSAGNATLAGTLTASDVQTSEVTTNELTAHDATISGTLYADRIMTKFGELLPSSPTNPSSPSATTIINNITNITNLVGTPSATPSPTPPYPSNPSNPSDASSSGLLMLLQNELSRASPSNQFATVSATSDLTIPGNLGVFADANISGNTSVAGSLFVGGPIRAGPEGLETIGDTLFIQKNKLANLDVLNGTLLVNSNGSVVINADLAVSGNVAIGGTLGVNTITSMGDNLTFDLARAGPEASPSDPSHPSSFGKLLVRGPAGPPVVTIDASGSAQFAGNLVASGSATIAKLNIVPPNIGGADFSAKTETAGTATLPTNALEIFIPSSQVTSNSLIYITPVTSTKNQVLFVKQKSEGVGFTVGVDTPVTNDIVLNWWIIN